MLSVIIGHRENNQIRRDNLKFLIDYYNKILKELCITYEIIVVEQDKKQKVDYDKPNLKKVFVFNDQPYNRSWGFNIGINEAYYRACLCIDNDIILPPLNIKEGLAKILENQTVFIPYENFLDLNEELTQNFKDNMNFRYLRKFINNGITERYDWASSDEQYKFGGCYFVDKWFYIDIGGMNELMTNYGGEDEEFGFRYAKVLEHQKKEIQPRNKYSNMFHLFHERIDYAWLRNQQFYKTNCKELERVRNMSYEELIPFIEEMKKNNGNPNKYRGVQQ